MARSAAWRRWVRCWWRWRWRAKVSPRLPQNRPCRRKKKCRRMPAAANRNRLPLPSRSIPTRRRAMEWGIKLEDVLGTGPRGRILTEDLERHRGAVKVAPRTGVEEIKLIGMRRRIADKMAQSKRQIPHFTYIEEFDLTELEALRADLNANRADGQPKLTLLPFFMCALVKLLPDFPNINALYDEAGGVLKRYA